MGDSHAGALFDYANEYLKTKNISALAISGGYCAPIINGFEAGGGCANIIENAFQRILNDDQISNVVLIAEWAVYTQGFRFTDTPRLWGDKQGKSQNISDNVNAFSRSFSTTIERLLNANKKIFVIYPVPEFYQHSYDWLGEQTLRGASVDISSAISSLPTISKNDYNKRNDEVFDVFDNHNENVTFLQVYDLFCSEEECKQYNEDMVLLYSDSNHVNYYGAKLIIDTFGSAFIN
ncbi:SGNH hydrolase domain-containing protein [Candidatus Pelagibacter bacterium]|nr:SGNH hydrolase domain-containing protein [Candidatus Pelagibacter bacterium]